MTRRRTALAIGLWCGFLLSAGTVFGTLHATLDPGLLGAGAVLSGVGVGLTVRVPGSRIGWLIALAGVSVSWMYLGNALPVAEWLRLFPEPVVVFFVWVGHWLWFLGLAALVYVLFLFPDGEVVSARWRPVAWLGAGGVLLLVGAFALAPFQDETLIRNPIQLTDSDLMMLPGGLLFGSFTVAALASLVARFRTANQRQRSQIKWITYAGALAIGVYATGGVLTQIPVVTWDLLTFIVLTAVPVAIGIAITRYRLYEIDRIVSRTMSYAVVVGALALVFAAGAVWLPQLFSVAESSLAVAASTLVVASLFNPLRLRVQGVVDRRFHRTRYDPEAVLSEMRARLRNEVEVARVGESLVAVSNDALEPATSAVWIRGRR